MRKNFFNNFVFFGLSRFHPCRGNTPISGFAGCATRTLLSGNRSMRPTVFRLRLKYQNRKQVRRIMDTMLLGAILYLSGT